MSSVRAGMVNENPKVTITYVITRIWTLASVRVVKRLHRGVRGGAADMPSSVCWKHAAGRCCLADFFNDVSWTGLHC